MLIGLLLPALNRAREQARVANCLSNLRQWGQFTTMYTNDNRGYFWTDTGSSFNATWMEALRPYYGNTNAPFRLCPDAQDLSTNGFGAETIAWTSGTSFNYFATGDYGSYGINHWINNLPIGAFFNPPASGVFTGWRTPNSNQWRKTYGPSTPSDPTNAPIFFDCTWYGANPMDASSNTPTSELASEIPPPSENWFYIKESASPSVSYNDLIFQYDMSRIALNRHNGKGINVCFLDGSVRYINKSALWSLNWYASYQTQSYVSMPF